ncbi:unnamed protein product [Debaryomyces tyrocola]|nr:unnamed protein product [Debaryomyces tyrocola]
MVLDDYGKKTDLPILTREDLIRSRYTRR